jgi:large subunit ribosomal protein L24
VNLRKGDLVEIITGEERGKRGKILRMTLDKDTGNRRVIVEGLNMAKKHQRPSGTAKPGGIVDLPNPIDLSNVALVCPRCNKRSRVRREPQEGHRIRVCKSCDEVIDT